MSNDTTTKYELTNQCTCDNEAEYTSCYGYCWDDNVNDFYNVNEKFLNSNDTGWWRVTNLGLWDGNHSGYFYVQPTDNTWTETENIVAGMTALTMASSISSGVSHGRNLVTPSDRVKVHMPRWPKCVSDTKNTAGIMLSKFL